MKISIAFNKIKRVYVDTSPLIYYVEQNPAYLARMDAIVNLLQTVPIQGVCSTITLAEVLPIPLRTGNTSLARLYKTILLNSREFLTFPVTSVVAEGAADLRASYGLKTPDALHLATALSSGCDAFLTNDLGLKRVTKIKVLVLDELELDPPKSTP